jgi:hypothetical protein
MNSSIFSYMNSRMLTVFVYWIQTCWTLIRPTPIVTSAFHKLIRRRFERSTPTPPARHAPPWQQRRASFSPADALLAHQARLHCHSVPRRPSPYRAHPPPQAPPPRLDRNPGSRQFPLPHPAHAPHSRICASRLRPPARSSQAPRASLLLRQPRPLGRAAPPNLHRARRAALHAGAAIHCC